MSNGAQHVGAVEQAIEPEAAAFVGLDPAPEGVRRVARVDPTLLQLVLGGEATEQGLELYRRPVVDAQTRVRAEQGGVPTSQTRMPARGSPSSSTTRPSIDPGSPASRRDHEVRPDGALGRRDGGGAAPAGTRDGAPRPPRPSRLVSSSNRKVPSTPVVTIRMAAATWAPSSGLPDASSTWPRRGPTLGRRGTQRDPDGVVVDRRNRSLVFDEAVAGRHQPRIGEGGHAREDEAPVGVGPGGEGALLGLVQHDVERTPGTHSRARPRPAASSIGRLAASVTSPASETPGATTSTGSAVWPLVPEPTYAPQHGGPSARRRCARRPRARVVTVKVAVARASPGGTGASPRSSNRSAMPPTGRNSTSSTRPRDRARGRGGRRRLLGGRGAGARPWRPRPDPGRSGPRAGRARRRVEGLRCVDRGGGSNAFGFIGLALRVPEDARQHDDASEHHGARREQGPFRIHDEHSQGRAGRHLGAGADRRSRPDGRRRAPALDEGQQGRHPRSAVAAATRVEALPQALEAAPQARANRGFRHRQARGDVRRRELVEVPQEERRAEGLLQLGHELDEHAVRRSALDDVQAFAGRLGARHRGLAGAAPLLAAVLLAQAVAQDRGQPAPRAALAGVGARPPQRPDPGLLGQVVGGVRVRDQAARESAHPGDVLEQPSELGRAGFGDGGHGIADGMPQRECSIPDSPRNPLPPGAPAVG